jgi:VWFA-related protein
MKKLFPAIVFLLSALLTDSFAQPEITPATQAPPPPKQSSSQAEKQPSASAAATAAGISYGILVDNSGSYRQILERIIEAVEDLVETNTDADEAFLMRFVNSDKIKLLQDFTASKNELREAANEMFVEGGLTAILDAVDFSARHLAENAGKDGAPRAKILVLITDGDERQSAVKMENVLKFLKDNQIRVFALGVSEEKVSTKILDRLTRETGGKNIVPKTRAELPAAVKELAAAIRAR